MQKGQNSINYHTLKFYYTALVSIIFYTHSVKANSGNPGQLYKHSTFWSRLAFEKSIGKVNVRLEFDLRQQNDFQKAGFNPLAKPFLRWFRFNTSYTTGKFTHSIILPNLIKNYPLAATQADLARPESTEWRFTVFEEYSQPYKKWSTALRIGGEYRIINNGIETRNTTRYRLRLNQTYKINSANTINLSYEPLYNGGPNKAPNTFSQSQTQLRIAHNFNKHLSLTTGINHLNRKRATLVDYDLENAILFNVMYKL